MPPSATNTPARPEPHRLCPLCGEDNRGLPPSRYSRDGWLLKQCRQCQLHYLENPPPVESLADEYNWSVTSQAESQRRSERNPMTAGLRASWKGWRRRWLPRRKLEELTERYVVAGSLLDVGCGTGAFLSQLPPALLPHGIEIDTDAIELARRSAEARGGRIIHADALTGLQRIDAAAMNGIVMHSFLEHEVHPLEVLQAARRVLCDTGSLIIKVPNFACWNRRYWQGSQWSGFRFPDHVNYFTPRTLSEIIAMAGLQIRRFTWRDRLATSDNMWLVAGKAALASGSGDEELRPAVFRHS